MLQLLHIEVKSFNPVCAVAARSDEQGGKALEETRQACGAVRVRNSLEAWGYYEAVWIALRAYFGEHYLPPLALVRAYRAGYRELYDDWDLWVGLEVVPDQATSLCNDTEFKRLFVSVDHDDHLDLLIVRDDGLDLYCTPREGSHTDTRERLFQPLLAGLVQLNLPAAHLPLWVTFVDDKGLHTVHLAGFLEQVALQ